MPAKGSQDLRLGSLPRAPNILTITLKSKNKTKKNPVNTAKVPDPGSVDLGLN